jgi:ATP-dependent DNA ligase
MAERVRPSRTALTSPKAKLKQILPSCSVYMVYGDHTTGDGQWLFQCACEMDPEGIVHKSSPYQDRLSSHSWIKIKNPDYSQKEGRMNG